MSNSTPMSLINIFVEPKSVFDNLKENKKWAVLGLLLIIAVTSVSSMMFFGGMSPEWLIEQQLMAAGDMSTSEREAAKQGMEMMADYMGIIAAISAGFMLPAITLIFTVYYLVVGSSAANTKPDFKFGDWFVFTIWTQMPGLVNTLGFTALFFTAASGDLPLSLPNYASLNQLVLGYLPGDALYQWAESINLFSLWSIVIAAIGFNRCCKMPMVKAFIFSALPLVVIFLGWFVLFT